MRPRRHSGITNQEPRCEYKDCQKIADYKVLSGSFCVTRVCRGHFAMIINVAELANTKAMSREGWSPSELPERKYPIIDED